MVVVKQDPKKKQSSDSLFHQFRKETRDSDLKEIVDRNQQHLSTSELRKRKRKYRLRKRAQERRRKRRQRQG